MKKKNWYLSKIGFLRKRFKKKILIHKGKTGNMKKVIKELEEITPLRPIHIRSLQLCKSLIFYQGILENDLLELKEEIERINLQITKNDVFDDWKDPINDHWDNY